MRTAVKYVIQDVDKACSSDTMLASIEECQSAKAELDPTASVVRKENFSGAPSGCSRWKGLWFFNSATGKLDGASEPVCRVASTSGWLHRPATKYIQRLFVVSCVAFVCR